MLCLSRKETEKIVITNEDTGERIIITTLETHDGNVKLGIKAPMNFKILRSELTERSDDDGEST